MKGLSIQIFVNENSSHSSAFFIIRNDSFKTLYFSFYSGLLVTFLSKNIIQFRYRETSIQQSEHQHTYFVLDSNT